MFTAPQRPLVTHYLDSTAAALVEGLDDRGHPCGECTWCRASIEPGDRYVTWNLTNRHGDIGLEHLCMECDWAIRLRQATHHIAYLHYG
jgi:hypothetical protein